MEENFGSFTILFLPNFLKLCFKESINYENKERIVLKKQTKFSLTIKRNNVKLGK